MGGASAHAAMSILNTLATTPAREGGLVRTGRGTGEEGAKYPAAHGAGEPGLGFESPPQGSQRSTANPGLRALPKVQKMSFALGEVAVCILSCRPPAGHQAGV
jgi:hypothetical protein